MVCISKQKKRAEGQEFSDRVYLKSFPVSATYKKFLLVKGGKTEQPAAVAVMNRWWAGFIFRVYPNVELEALKNSRVFLPGCSYRHIPKKLSLISLQNEGSLQKTPSAIVGKKLQNLLPLRINNLNLNMIGLDSIITVFLFHFFFKFGFSLLVDHES